VAHNQRMFHVEHSSFSKREWIAGGRTREPKPRLTLARIVPRGTIGPRDHTPELNCAVILLSQPKAAPQLGLDGLLALRAMASDVEECSTWNIPDSEQTIRAAKRMAQRPLIFGFS
jgi:hypothetical protein